MMVSYVLSRDGTVVHPFDSIYSVEKLLLEKKYLIVAEGDAFYGLLTATDVILRAHNLVLDCITEKPAIAIDDDVERALAVMREAREYVLPVFDGSGKFAGCACYYRILQELGVLQKQPMHIQIKNIIGPNEIEESKQAFIGELYHNTKNPLQVIFSSLSLFRDVSTIQEREVLLNTIYGSAKQLDEIFNGLFLEYFPENSSHDR